MPFNILIASIILAYGLIIGSFLNVVIYRLPRGKNLVYPRSHCPNCNTKLRVCDLIPVFSFLIAGGKCRYCEQKISWIYLSIEILNAALYLGIYLFKGLSLYSGFLMLTASVLICIAMIDLAHYKIPNSLNALLAVFAVIAIGLQFITLQNALLGAAVGGGIILALNLLGQWLGAKAFGMGDIKYMLAAGALLGFPSILYILFYASIVAGATILLNLAARRWNTKTVFAFGPFLAVGTYIVMLLH